MTTWNDAESALRPELDGAGFEILGAVTVGAYNCTLEPELDDHRLPAVHRDDDVALVIGNTRRLWPLFLHAYANTPIRDEAHPLDAYSRWNIGAAVRLVGVHRSTGSHARAQRQRLFTRSFPRELASVARNA